MPLIWLLALIACEPLGPIEDTTSTASISEQEALIAEPSTLDFSSVSVNEDGLALLHYTVTNIGDTTLSVYDHGNVLGDADGVFSVDSEAYFELDPGDARLIPVTFTPYTSASHSGRIRINASAATVQLIGSGTAPVIALDASPPKSVAFGCQSSFPLTISNTGDERLELHSIQLSNTDDYTLESALPAAIEPGQVATLMIRFAPAYDANDTERPLEVLITSNDPYTPERLLSLDVLAQNGSSLIDKTFSYYPGLMVDLLVAVDVSGVMSAHLSKAEAAFPTLTETMLEANVDLHTALLTGGQLCPTHIDLSGESSAESLADGLSEGLEGPSGSGDGALMMHAISALSSAGQCLSGFTREDAMLHLVVITGQEDSSGVDVDEQVSALLSAAPLSSSLLISTIAATSDSGCQGATYGAGYIDAAISQGGEVGDLCQSSWATAMENIALISSSQSVGGLQVLLDDGVPLEESLTVTVDGALFTDWTYDAESNAVLFSSDNPPGTGTEVSITYLESIACDD